VSTTYVLPLPWTLLSLLLGTNLSPTAGIASLIWIRFNLNVAQLLPFVFYHSLSHTHTLTTLPVPSQAKSDVVDSTQGLAVGRNSLQLRRLGPSRWQSDRVPAGMLSLPRHSEISGKNANSWPQWPTNKGSLGLESFALFDPLAASPRRPSGVPS
jgi:hypothetical protein